MKAVRELRGFDPEALPEAEETVGWLLPDLRCPVMDNSIPRRGDARLALPCPIPLRVFRCSIRALLQRSLRPSR